MSLYLSRLVIPLDQLLKNRLMDDYKIHQLVYRMCLEPDESRDFLYYVSHTPYGGASIIIQSHRELKDCGVGRLEAKEIPEEFFDFPKYSFLVRIRPVEKNNGDVVKVLYKTDEVIDWLCSRGPRLGIEFLPETMDKQRGDKISFRNNNKRTITIAYADISGILEVKDYAKFRSTVETGIGGNKGFGLGLLQLKPMR